VTVTNAHGCSAGDSAVVTIHAKPIVSVSDIAFCAGSSGILDAGNSGATYLWSTNETTQTISVSQSGTYSVTVTDANGCSASDAAVVTIHANPIVSVSDISFCAGSSGILDAEIPGVFYLWSTSETTREIYVNTAGIYSVTVTDSNGCMGIDSATVSINQNPLVELSDAQICGNSSVILDAGNAGMNYLWSTQDTTQTIIVSQPGTYSVMVTNANGCSASDTANVSTSTSSAFTISLGNNRNVFYGALGYNGCTNINATNSGGAAPFSYVWSATDPTNTITSASSASITICNTYDTSYTYTVVVTDANGCSVTESVTLNFINISCHPTNQKKVSVCHVPPGNPLNCKTICVADNAVPALLNQGSYLGHCLPNCDIPSGESENEQLTGITSVSKPGIHLTAYPNPFKNITHIEVKLEKNDEVLMQVFNANGALIKDVYRGKLDQGYTHQFDIDGSSMRSGMYFLKMITGDVVLNLKLIIAR
jgi:hypothetical protein